MIGSSIFGILFTILTLIISGGHHTHDIIIGLAAAYFSHWLSYKIWFILTKNYLIAYCFIGRAIKNVLNYKIYCWKSTENKQEHFLNQDWKTFK